MQSRAIDPDAHHGMRRRVAAPLGALAGCRPESKLPVGNYMPSKPMPDGL